MIVDSRAAGKPVTLNEYDPSISESAATDFAENYGSLSAPIQGYYGKDCYESDSKSIYEPQQASKLIRNISITALQLEDAVGSSLALAIDNLDLNGRISKVPSYSVDRSLDLKGKDFLPHLAFEPSSTLSNISNLSSRRNLMNRYVSFSTYEDGAESYRLPLSAPPHPTYSKSNMYSQSRSKSTYDFTVLHDPHMNNLMRKNKSQYELELEPFLSDERSHSLVLLGVERIPLSKLSESCQNHGAIYYFRTEHHSKGILFLAYLDKRAALRAYSDLLNELRALGAVAASIHYIVSMHAASFSHDSSVHLCNIPIGTDDGAVSRICQSLGDICQIHISSSTDELFVDATVHYFNISDAQLAVRHLNANPPRLFGRNFYARMTPRSNQEREIGAQLLALLTSWQTQQGGTGISSSAQSHRLQEESRAPLWHTRNSMSNVSDSDSSLDSMTTSDELSPSAASVSIERQCLAASSPVETSNEVPLDTRDVSGHRRSPDIPARYKLNHGGSMQSISAATISKSEDFGLDLNRVASGLDRRTTIMIRNIPNKYTQTMLLGEIDINFKGAYDFFYLPIDFKNKCNVGYAFINFMDHRHIVQFTREFHGQRWRNFNSEKVCAISYARIQGKLSMISRFQNSSLMDKECEYRPLLFYSSGPEKGSPESFPVGSKLQRRQTHLPSSAAAAATSIR